MHNKKVELLAPAGSFDAFLVALASGADAVYISGKSFGARAFAKNFTLEEIKEAVRYAHILEKKVYVTINTLVYNHELDELTKFIDELYYLKVDALIVQDLGVVNIIKKIHPDFIIHASTQMSIYNEKGIEILKKLGIKRAILARETPLEEVEKISKHNVETEIFVHGALCYAYSGNCLMSYAIGKRSGNRGACAQPCRKKYSLKENNTFIVNNQSIISMKDLCTLEDIDKVISSGVTSLKVEGRMKSLEYIKTVISLYRKKIDEYYRRKLTKISKDEEKNLLVTFNRGFTKGYLLNDSNKNRTNFHSVNHQGIVLGNVVKVNNKKITIKLSSDLSFKDGIRFKGKSETGAYVNEMFLDNKLVKFAPKNSLVTLVLNTPCNVGDTAYKTVDYKLQEDALNLVKNFPLKRDIELEIRIKHNEPMILSAFCEDAFVTCKSDKLTQVANNPIDETRIKEQLLKLNNTLFKCINVTVSYDQKAFFQIKELNELRRKVIELLEEELIGKVEREKLLINEFNEVNIVDTDDLIEVVCFNELQKETCEKLGINTIYYNENYNDRFEKKIKTNAMIHNLGQINNESNELVTSIYMNVLNNESINLLEKLGFSKIYLSNELEKDELNLISSNKATIGYFIYGRCDLMVSNQCFIASSKGFINKKCGSCINSKYKLIDEYNNEFPILCDINNCDVRILSNIIRNDIPHIKNILKTNVKKLLVIFTTEEEDEIIKVIGSIKKEIKNISF